MFVKISEIYFFKNLIHLSSSLSEDAAERCLRIGSRAIGRFRI